MKHGVSTRWFPLKIFKGVLFTPNQPTIAGETTPWVCARFMLSSMQRVSFETKHFISATKAPGYQPKVPPAAAGVPIHI
jgi:hypothetical protein